MACSSPERKKNKPAQKKTTTSRCDVTDIFSKHVKLYSEYNLPNLKKCLENYIKLSKTSLDVKICNKLIVKRNGKVSSVYTSGENIPTDLKWCVEQALWKADFSLLQINQKINVKFPLHFYHK